MNEKELSIRELSERIDQLLNVLSMISRDLTEITKSLKTVSATTPVSTAPAADIEGTRNLEDVRTLFSSDLEGMLTFEEVEEWIIIKTRKFLGSDSFAKIASVVRSLGGEYISAGRDSHFKVSKKIE